MRISKSKINILIIEDSETSAMLIQSIFQEETQYQSSIAQNAAKAKSMLKKEDFDLILLDLMMPKVDGYTLLDELKHDELLKSIPVVIVSALSTSESIKRCKELGAKAYIFKPIGKNKLLEKINQILKELYVFE
jgi:CheY-like chemotaxis protein